MAARERRWGVGVFGKIRNVVTVRKEKAHMKRELALRGGGG